MRRRDRQQSIRRRRRAALTSRTIVLALVIALVILSATGSSSKPAGTHSPQTARSGQRGGPDARSLGARAVNASGSPGTSAVPILMYHVIAAPPAGAPYPGLYVEPAEFTEQMQALKRAGWHAVTLNQVYEYWRRGASLGPGKPIVLSFDNGYNSQYTQALPVLHSLGWVGDENIQLTGLPPSQGGLGENQIRGLLAAGWELDTQGISHAALITLGAEALHDQVAVARQNLQQRYHVPVNWFCYPSGQYDATVETAVKAAGFVGSTTVVPGWAHRNDNPYRLPRLRVLGGTSASQLLEQLQSTRANPPAPASYSA